MPCFALGKVLFSAPGLTGTSNDMKKILFFTLAAVLAWNSYLSADQRPWENENLPRQERIEALLDAMTVDEKMAQLLYASPYKGDRVKLGLPDDQ